MSRRLRNKVIAALVSWNKQTKSKFKNWRFFSIDGDDNDNDDGDGEGDDDVNINSRRQTTTKWTWAHLFLRWHWMTRFKTRDQLTRKRFVAKDNLVNILSTWRNKRKAAIAQNRSNNCLDTEIEDEYHAIGWIGTRDFQRITSAAEPSDPLTYAEWHHASKEGLLSGFQA